MPTETLFSGMLKPFLILIVCLAVAAIIKALKSSKTIKGAVGEGLLKLHLRKLNADQYHIINDITLPTQKGSTQIDHIVLSTYGIFVIETKNMQGWIFGSANQKQWTQKLYKQSFKFQNPLHQNFKHTQTLIDLIGLDKTKVFSIIAFDEKATFKTELPENVLHYHEVAKYIQQHQQALFTDSEIVSIQQQIAAIQKPTNAQTKREHIQHLKELHKK